VTIDDARAEFRALDAALAIEAPERHGGWTSQLLPLRDAMYGWTLTPVFTLQVAAALLLVLACVNIAGLLLIRGVARAPEIRLRLALGAGAGRIARQLMAEGMLLSAAGGAAGVFVAWLGLQATAAAMTPPLGQARVPDLILDVRVLGAALLLTVASVLAFALVPALRTAGSRRGRIGTPRCPCLNTPARRLARDIGGGAGRHSARRGGTARESFVLVATRDLGFDPSGLVTFDFRAPGWLPRQIGEYQGFQYFEINPGPGRTLERIFDRLRRFTGRGRRGQRASGARQRNDRDRAGPFDRSL
jgi:hypothetical protein